jgi:hypothetical protein
MDAQRRIVFLLALLVLVLDCEQKEEEDYLQFSFIRIW